MGTVWGDVIAKRLGNHDRADRLLHNPSSIPVLFFLCVPLRPLRLCVENCSLDDFEQAGGTHAAADAHGDDHELDTATLAFDQRVADQAAAGHAIRMT